MLARRSPPGRGSRPILAHRSRPEDPDRPGILLRGGRLRRQCSLASRDGFGPIAFVTTTLDRTRLGRISYGVGCLSTNLGRHKSLLLPLLAERRDLVVYVLARLLLQAPMRIRVVWAVSAVEPYRVGEWGVGNGGHGAVWSGWEG